MCNPIPNGGDLQNEQTEAKLLAQELQNELYVILGPTEVNRNNVAEAILADALGLPGQGRYNDRVSRGFAVLDQAQLARHVTVMRTLLALARGYASYRAYRRTSQR